MSIALILYAIGAVHAFYATAESMFEQYFGDEEKLPDWMELPESWEVVVILFVFSLAWPLDAVVSAIRNRKVLTARIVSLWNGRANRKAAQK